MSKRNSLIPIGTYQSTVRVGNWYEDFVKKDDRELSFIERRDNGKLVVGNMNRIFNNLSKPLDLKAPDDFIRFGSIVQLMPRIEICGRRTNYPLALSITINERGVNLCQMINENCEITVAPSMKRCMRNTFQIASNDENNPRAGEALKYGQRFRLECIETQNNEPHYLYSAFKSADLSNVVPRSYESFKNGEINLYPGLCPRSKCGQDTVASGACDWICTYVDQDMRFRTNGTPIRPNTFFIISHCATNRNLAVENIRIQTIFGLEYLVSVQTYKDVHKKDKLENVWKFSDGHRFKLY